MRSRIAIFEGHTVPRKLRAKRRRLGAPLFNNPRMQNYGAPLFNNPRMQRYGAPLFTNPNTQLRGPSVVQSLSRYGQDLEVLPRGYGRAAYRVSSRAVRSPYAYGPRGEHPGQYEPRVKRRAYKVKRMKDTPAMKKAQARFRKAAKKCSRRRSGSYQQCMKKALKKKGRR